MFQEGQLKNFDNAIMVDGYIVDVEESASNDSEQALLHVKLLAREMTFIHKDGRNLVLDISKGEQ